MAAGGVVRGSEGHKGRRARAIMPRYPRHFFHFHPNSISQDSGLSVSRLSATMMGRLA